MVTPLTVFVGSLTVFVGYLLLVGVESAKQRRVVLVGVRTFSDRVLDSAIKHISTGWDHFVQFIVKLGWYYSIHSFLHTLMNVLVSLYDYLESKFETNRQRALHLHKQKLAKREGGHLSQVAEHKAQVALTPEEGDRLKEEKLEGRD